MKNPPFEEKESENVPTLKTLNDVKVYLQKLKVDIRSGSLSAQDIDFIPIFLAIQQIVDAENLRNLVSEFQNSSDLFARKIQDIRMYISSIGGEEEFENYVKVHSLDSLNSLMQELFNPPLIIEEIDLETIVSSFTRLTNRKKFLTIEFPDFSDVERNGSAEDFDGLIDEVHFERDIQIFQHFLMPQLPKSLPDLLKSAPNDGVRYNYFVYCLYLIQRKVIVFNKKTNELHPYTTEVDK